MFRGGPFGMGEGVPPFFGGAGIGGNFKQQYRCYSVAMSPATNPQGLEEGGKIIMPPSALSELTRLNIQYPMLFKLTSNRSKSTHCGVLEFVAEEGKIYIPHWMMNNICIQEGDLVWVENVTLPLATFAKFQPQTVDFLDITDPKAVLELKLRHFACLTKGDTIAVHYNNKVYELLVLDTKPDKAMSIIECDMQVDFAAPVGYKAPPTPEPRVEEIDSPLDWSSVPAELMDFTPFGGSGQRLDGKKKKTAGKGKASSSTDTGAVSQATHKRGIPHYNYKVGKLKFFSAKSLEAMVKKREDEKKTELSEFTPFEGGGKQLKPRKRAT